MGFKKFGTGEVTETDGTLSKTAAGSEWTDNDSQALQEENTQADQTDRTED